MADYEKHYIIEFCSKTYKIRKDVANFLFSKLENTNIENLSSLKAVKLFNKYKMLDEKVLDELVKI